MKVVEIRYMAPEDGAFECESNENHGFKGTFYRYKHTWNWQVKFCEACAEGKAHRAPYKPVGEIQLTRRLELVHSDVASPMKTESSEGAKYSVTFIDNYSRCITLYLMKLKQIVKLKCYEQTMVGNTHLQSLKIF